MLQIIQHIHVSIQIRHGAGREELTTKASGVFRTKDFSKEMQHLKYQHDLGSEVTVWHLLLLPLVV